MTKVRFVSQGGSDETIVDIEDGTSVMAGAIANGIDGIDADCGGQLSCATCQIYVDPSWLKKLDPPSAEERDLLELAVNCNEHSRLSCQIVLRPDLCGLTVHVPEFQH